MHNNLFYLIDDIACWNIFFDCLVFKRDGRDEDSKFFYVVKFNKNNDNPTTTKIKDIFNDSSQVHIGVWQKYFFIGNDSKIKILDYESLANDAKINFYDTKVKFNLEKKAVKDQAQIVPAEQDFETFQMAPNTKLRGFFENLDSKGKFLLLIIENSQHIIGFAKMSPSIGVEPGKPKFQF